MSMEAVLANEERWHVEVGDVLQGLAKLPDGCLQTVVTSPPYWGLRSYLPADHPNKAIEIGSEPTPEAFIAKMVEIFRAVRRVLRDDGTLWLNLGETYATGAGKVGHCPGGGQQGEKFKAHFGKHSPGSAPAMQSLTQPNRMPIAGLKSGDLCNIPHRVAAALQADGWYWRSTIIWSKRSPMPESRTGWRWRRHRIKTGRRIPVPQGGLSSWDMGEHAHGKPGDYRGQEKTIPEYIDCPGCEACQPNDGYVLRAGSWRPTTAHEYVFIFTKNQRYFCDGDAAQEPSVSVNPLHPSYRPNSVEIANNGRKEFSAKNDRSMRSYSQFRNPRSVWTIGSEPEKAKHFATFPSTLPKKCLQAATSSAGCCPKCGACYAPVVESERVATRPGEQTKVTEHADRLEIGNRDPQRHIAVTKVTGYRPTCTCNAGDPIPPLVCDIFSGSGTTGRVAYSMGLRYIGFELSEEYAAISREKIVRPFKKGKPLPKHKRPMDDQKSLFE